MNLVKSMEETLNKMYSTKEEKNGNGEKIKLSKKKEKVELNPKIEDEMTEAKTHNKEDHDCDEVHPGESHKEWEKENVEKEAKYRSPRDYDDLGVGSIKYYRKKGDKKAKRKEEVDVDEAVLVNRDYKYDGKKIHISKKNFKKVHKDYKNDTPGKERMITYDSKWGTVSVPVEFTEEVELDEMGAMSAIDPDEVSLPDIVANAKKYGMSASDFKTWVKKNLWLIPKKDQAKAIKLFGEDSGRD